MNKQLIQLLLAGNNRFNIDIVKAHIGMNQELFDDLIEIMLGAEKPIPQRAAWAMTAIIDNHPWMVNNSIVKLIDSMPTFSHPALTRSLLRVLAQIELPGDKIGELFDFCYNYLSDPKQPSAIRVFAMQVLFNISELEPDLKYELKLILESQFDYGSAGFKNRAEKLIYKLNKSIISE
jgi:hypothetical protein